MITINGKEYRNLQEQVLENMDQIESLQNKEADTLLATGITAGQVLTADGNGGTFKENGAYTFPVGDGYYPEEVQDAAIDEAIALLEYAGFKFENGKLSADTPLNITYLTNDGTGHIGVAQIMQQDFAEIGINMTIDKREWNVFLDERKQGNFDFAREGWLADFNDPINMLEMWTSDSGNNDCQFGR